MMKLKTFPFISILFLSFLLNACKKDNEVQADQLPAATQTGANTFGCLINGKVYIPKGYDGTGTPNPHVQYDYDVNGNPYFFIEANQYSKNTSLAGIIISFKNLTQEGIYNIPNKFTYSIDVPSVIGDCGATSLDGSVQAWEGELLLSLT